MASLRIPIPKSSQGLLDAFPAPLLVAGLVACEEIVPAIFYGHEDGLFYVREAGTEVPSEPTHQMYQTVEVPTDLEESTIEAAEECPGECIFLEP